MATIISTTPAVTTPPDPSLALIPPGMTLEQFLVLENKLGTYLFISPLTSAKPLHSNDWNSSRRDTWYHSLGLVRVFHGRSALF